MNALYLECTLFRMHSVTDFAFFCRLCYIVVKFRTVQITLGIEMAPTIHFINFH